MLDSINTLQTKISYSYIDCKSDVINITNNELLYLYHAMVLYSYNKNNKYIEETKKLLVKLNNIFGGVS